MDTVLLTVKELLAHPTTDIDNIMFRLHHTITTMLLFAFAIIITWNHLIGDPIDCISRDDIPSEVLDTFCWTHGTFSLPRAWNKSIGDEIPYPGVDKSKIDDQKVYHSYYQWVCFLLFLQSVMFYAPHYFWKMLERGLIRQLSIDICSPMTQPETMEQKRKQLADYLVKTFGHHKCYAFKYYFCELLNFVNVVGQILFTDLFLGGEFIKYGIYVSQFNDWDPSVTYDPMIRVFPRLTKCTFHRYGPSGDVQRHDALCIIPINILNEKIYIILWFWFILLAAMSGLVLLYRVALALVPSVRYYVMKLKVCYPTENLRLVLRKCGPTDYFFLNLLSKNINFLTFKELIDEVAITLDHESTRMRCDESTTFLLESPPNE